MHHGVRYGSPLLREGSGVGLKRSEDLYTSPAPSEGLAQRYPKTGLV